MSSAQSERIQRLLAAEHSPQRAELLELAFAALAGIPLASVVSGASLAQLVAAALTQENAERVAARHVLPGIERVVASLDGASERVRDMLSPVAEQQLRALLAGGSGARLGWLKGALDAEDFRQLLAPVVQQVLVQFTTKLPLPGLAGAQAGALSGLVGRLGKQMQKSAGQLADVGKSVMSGLGGELERRMQALARDFSQSATNEFRAALIDRLGSAEGRAILARMRERVLEHVLATELQELASDFARLPQAEIAQLATQVLGALPERPLFGRVLQREIEGVLAELGEASLEQLLAQAGVLELARAQLLAALEPGLQRLLAGPAFGAWLERLLNETAQP